jgi:hypothetical protein
MLKKILVLICIAAAVSCQGRKPRLLPIAGEQFCSMSIKFNFRDPQGRQNGRVHWRFDDRSSKFIFFTPLNQVGLELNVAGEEAVLVNFSKKVFWKGDFSLLLDRLWGIGLPLAELRSLLDAGLVPRGGFEEKGIAADVERDALSGAPRSVRLRRGAAVLTLRITRSEFRPGRIVLVDYASRYRPAGLEAVLEK